MIELKNISKSYKNKNVLQIEHLELKNDIIGLVGNNGAGKTTLLNIILDLVKADKGEVLIDNNNVSKNDEWKQITGSYIDDSFLIHFLTPEEFFLFNANIRKIKKTTLFNNLETFKVFFNNEILNQAKIIDTLSKGNKLKVGIANALFFKPKIVILDEPLEGLDPGSQIIFHKIIKSYYQKYNATIIISSHNLNFISEVSTKIIILENGKIKKQFINNGNSVEKQWKFS